MKFSYHFFFVPKHFWREKEKTINYTDAVFILRYTQKSELLIVNQERNKLHFSLRFTGAAFITQRITE